MAPCVRLEYRRDTGGLRAAPVLPGRLGLLSLCLFSLSFLPHPKPNRKAERGGELGGLFVTGKGSRVGEETIFFSHLRMKHFLPNLLNHYRLHVCVQMDRVRGLRKDSLHQVSLFHNQTR